MAPKAQITFKSTSQRLNELLENKKNRTYFVAFVTFFFVFVMAIFGIIPAYNSAITQGEENVKRDELIQKLNTKLATSKKLNDELNTNEEIIEYFDKVFPNESIQENVIILINKLGKINNVAISSMSFADLTQDQILYLQASDRIKAESTSIALEGNQENISNFVNALEKSRRIFDVQSVSVSRKADQSVQEFGGNDFIATIQAYYFYFGQANVTPTP